MSFSSSTEKAFKSKAKHFSSVLDLPLSRGQQLFSKVLGYRDFDEAQRAGLVIRQLASREQLCDRIRATVPGISPDKIDQLLSELNLPTTDRVIAQLWSGRTFSAGFSRYFSSGTFSEYHQQCLREVGPVFGKVHNLSTTIGKADQATVDIQQVVANLGNLSKDDVNTAVHLLSPCYKEHPDFLPVSAAMLVLHAAENRRSARVLSKTALAVLNGMLACVAASAFLKADYKISTELEVYGLAIAGVQRRMGEHDVCMDILRGIVVLYQEERRHHLDSLTHSLINVEAAFAALFAGRFDAVVEILSSQFNEGVRHSYPVMAIEAMASAQLGDEQHATKLIDILLCDNDVRLGLGLNHECPIARRRPETMPLSVNVLEYLERTTLDRLRYLDLATFKFAHALFMRREKRMLATLASSELLFKEVRFLRDERFSEVPAKKRSKTLDLVVWYTPVVLRFGPARGRNQTDCRDFQVVMILTGALGTAQWVRAPQLAEAFKGNAYFATDPAKERWLTHIISSSHIKVSMIDAGVRGRLRAAYRGSGDLSRDELCFELFRETEKTRHKYDPPRETRTISDDLASQLINAFRAPVNEYLARCDATGAAK